MRIILLARSLENPPVMERFPSQRVSNAKASPYHLVNMLCYMNTPCNISSDQKSESEIDLTRRNTNE